jgi:prolyl oligopeptidase
MQQTLTALETAMKNLTVAVLAIVVCLIAGCEPGGDPGPPTARIENVIDEHYGTKVDDPYRYMENVKAPEVRSWIKGQARYAAGVLSALPGRDALLARLVELDSGRAHKIRGLVRLADGTLFYTKMGAGDNISKLYVRFSADNLDKLLIDPEKIPSVGSQHYSISTYNPSPDGRFVVYGLAKGGSEETVLHVLNVRTGKDLPDTIDRIETAYNYPAWSADNKGFFYCRRRKLAAGAPATEVYKKSKVCYHKLGDRQGEDKDILGWGISELVKLGEADFPSISIPANSDFAIAKIKHGDSNELTLYAAPVKTLLSADIPWVRVCDVEDEVTRFAVLADSIYLKTAKDAPRFKVIKTSLNNPDITKARVLIPASRSVVDRIEAAKDALYVVINDGGVNRIARMEYKENAAVKMLELPDNRGGYIVSASPRLAGVLVSTSSWTKGSLIYSFDPASGEFTDSGLLPRGKFDDLPGFVSTETKAKSHDGVMVPLSIIHKKGLKLDGDNPTLLSGYGAYGFSSNVRFRPLSIAWLERGGVLAVAHVRGGGEYGKEWHHAGRMLTKPNTWKDFIACAEYLIENRYTSKKRLAGQGGSAGGILIGRAITERPDLFAAAICSVGVMDAIRMETTTNGVPNIAEFGTVTNEDGFRGLHAMSAYHHVKDGVSYPAVLLTHGANDPRVELWMSAKMTARLQAATSSGKPVLFRVDYRAGHGVGSTMRQKLEQTADKWSFLFAQF